MSNDIKRVTGLLIFEVINSNPNGNPDQESDPRVRDTGQPRRAAMPRKV